MPGRMHIITGLLLASVLVAGSCILLKSGIYGWTVFVIAPAAVGALSAWLFQPPTESDAAVVGAFATMAAAFSLLGFRLEGLVCIVMSLPLVVPIGAAAATLVCRAQRARVPAQHLTVLLLVPVATLTWDTTAQPPIYKVTTAITVAAPPEQVWKHVVAFSPLPEPREWYFRAGIAYPERARIEGLGHGAIRYCEFSTGAFVEPIEVWDEPQQLRFRVTRNPAPLQEWSPYRKIAPKHLHGYLISSQGEFRLSRLPNGYTLLQGTTWYQHGLWPAEYWRWWSDAIIHRIHRRVLNHVRALAEQDQKRSW